MRFRSYGSFPCWLLAICACTDFAAFVIIFTVTRRLAESQSPAWWMGALGATLSLASATSSLGGGLLARRLDTRIIFLAGVCSLLVGIVLCGVLPPGGAELAAGYMLLGLGLGGLYPPLMGWLNRGGSQATSSGTTGVTLRLVLFCVAWNLGIMAGQLTGGWLFARGATVAVGVATAAGIVNLLLAIVVVNRVPKERPETLGPAEAVVDKRPVALFQRLSWMANVGGMFGAAMVVHLIADLAVAIQISSKTQGILMACWRAVTIVTYLAMYRLRFWQFRLAPQVMSSVLGAIGLLVIAQADSEVGLFFGLVLLGQLVGFNYFGGLFYSSAGPSVKQRTLAAGLHEASLAVGMSVGTLAGGWLATQYGHRVPYQFAAVGILLFLLLQVAVALQQREPI